MIVQLFDLAHGRSGDKGNSVNIGVIAREPEFYPFLVDTLTAERVMEHMTPISRGPCRRYELPNLCALNFLILNALGGGGSTSLRLDAQGKTYAQALLRMEVEVPEDISDRMSRGDG